MIPEQRLGCPACGAPVPPETTGRFRCSFCDTVSEQPVWISWEQVERFDRQTVLGLLLMVVGSVILAGIIYMQAPG